MKISFINWKNKEHFSMSIATATAPPQVPPTWLFFIAQFRASRPAREGPQVTTVAGATSIRSIASSPATTLSLSERMYMARSVLGGNLKGHLRLRQKAAHAQMKTFFAPWKLMTSKGL